jgi:hypothetical protein
MKSKKSKVGLERALDSVRFGDQNILNLRESLPSAADAASRAEQWLRQKQVEAVDEVLVITGRGNNSENGISPVREAIIRLIGSLRRRNVVEHYEEHTPGSFSIRLASIGAMIDAPRRRREKGQKPANESLPELSTTSRRMLRDVAERALEGLGIKQTQDFLDAEMQRQLRAISAAVGTGPGHDERLRAALRAALDQTI